MVHEEGDRRLGAALRALRVSTDGSLDLDRALRARQIICSLHPLRGLIHIYKGLYRGLLQGLLRGILGV